MVAKQLGSRYESGERSTAWQKLRLNISQEFVVGGYIPGNPFDALLVGYHDNAGALMFAARVRAGFTPASRRQVFKRLPQSPFVNLPMGKQGGGHRPQMLLLANAFSALLREEREQRAHLEDAFCRG